jgi:hypothetical protein
MDMHPSGQKTQGVVQIESAQRCLDLRSLRKTMVMTGITQRCGGSDSTVPACVNRGPTRSRTGPS